MKTYDWLVIGGGITGAALAYELKRNSLTVLLLEQNQKPDNATHYSYGGLAYWSGTCKLTRQLCQEGLAVHRQLSAELEAETEFREIDLLLPVEREDDPQLWAERYGQFAIQPQVLTAQAACELEPLLNREAISGALHLPHGHVQAHKTTLGYLTAFQRLGGERAIAPVVELVWQGDRVTGVKTPTQNYTGVNTVVCAGGLSRSLLQAAGIKVPLYFTHAELIETPPVDLHLRTLVMPARNRRLALEAQATTPEAEAAWQAGDRALAPAIVDPGAIQFLDGHLCIGQLSRIHPNPQAAIDREASEAAIRAAVGQVLPAIASLPGTWHHCLVAFSPNSLPRVGAIAPFEGIHVFSGFTSTILFAPPLARHFAAWATGQADQVMAQLAGLGAR